MSLSFMPLVPPFVLVFAALISLFLCGAGLLKFGPRAWLRLLAFTALLLVLANPQLTREERQPIESTVAVIVDRSQSQKLGQRWRDSDEALAALKAELASYPQLKTRIVEVATANSGQDSSTRLVEPLRSLLADVPPSEVAGAIFITDGQVHDSSDSMRKVGFDAPVNALITGHPDEFDRKIRFIDAPRFGLAGKSLTLTFIVEDQGKVPANQGDIVVKLNVNGQTQQQINVVVNKPQSVEVKLPHSGKNIVEVTSQTLPGQLSAVVNASSQIEAIKEHLRVLLVSGEPHNGERTWRDLLKSDTGVDLVHFTILRPPEKVDDTPISQLSLIVFPTTELFVDKLKDFDLVIFDRYQHYDILPMLYYDNMAEYVRNGGALLMAVGPEYAGQMSLARTPLVNVLPALPSGDVVEQAFTPRLTAAGTKSPVTRGLAGSETNPPHWGRWLRQIPVKNTGDSTVLMTGVDDKPLLLLSRVGKGRVGMLLSDQGWLWARGFEGGGPYAALYRRLAHWLMKEPDLEEEALTADGSNGHLVVRRQTMQEKAPPALVTTPAGEKITLTLNKQHDGIFAGSMDSDEVGLFEVTNGDLKTFVHLGPQTALENAVLVSTTKKLQPIADLSGGHVLRVHQTSADKVHVPAVVLSDQKMPGSSNIVLKPTKDTRLIAVRHIPLFQGILPLIVVLLLFGMTWYRESR